MVPIPKRFASRTRSPTAKRYRSFPTTDLWFCSIRAILFAHDSPPFDPTTAANQWPSLQAWNTHAGELFDDMTLRQLAERELAAKHVDRDELLEQLTYLHENWDELRQRLKPQLIPLDQLRSMLSAVGAPIDSSSIGISPQRLAVSFHKAQMIRRRFTVLDVAVRIGLMPDDVADPA